MRLIDSLATTPGLAEVFSDISVLHSMLQFEAALATAEARVGVIPESAAASIAAAAIPEGFDIALLAEKSLRAGTPAIPLVSALTDRVRASSEESARFVHWGATSQDVADTAIVLLLDRSRAILAADHHALQAALRRLSGQHAGAVMLGRTLLQAAPLVTFGLKAAGWFGAAIRGWKRVDSRFEESRFLQFGGASGTLAALGENGIAVARALAAELRLKLPDAPWHTHRDRLAALVCACGVYVGSLAKMARDIALLMQNEVAEAAEPAGVGRGGSSTMPHKRNPTGCSLTLAAAARVPGYVSQFLSGMAQEHERAVGGWQAEWATIARVIQDTGLALASMREVAEGLVVHPRRMRENIASTRGVVFAERAAMLLGPALGRAVAHEILEQATRRAIETGRNLKQVLAEIPEVTRVLTPAQIDDLDSPESYLGSAEIFRKQLLESSE
jgi:3-carboxy-cis,cis-muconate cycloisomerase